jgi:RHS repeat-associated protein
VCFGGKEKPTALASGVINMGARVYTPQTGRFDQTDPIPGGGANAYGYTDGDPVNETDLTGRGVTLMCSRSYKTGKLLVRSEASTCNDPGPSWSTVLGVGTDVVAGGVCVGTAGGACAAAIAGASLVNATLDVAHHKPAIDVATDLLVGGAGDGMFALGDKLLEKAGAPLALRWGQRFVNTSLVGGLDAAKDVRRRN